VFTKPYITARLLINTPNSSAIEKEKKKKERKNPILYSSPNVYPIKLSKKIFVLLGLKIEISI
jgi:hypothetical protein